MDATCFNNCVVSRRSHLNICEFEGTKQIIFFFLNVSDYYQGNAIVERKIKSLKFGCKHFTFIRKNTVFVIIFALFIFVLL